MSFLPFALGVIGDPEGSGGTVSVAGMYSIRKLDAIRLHVSKQLARPLADIFAAFAVKSDGLRIHRSLADEIYIPHSIRHGCRWKQQDVATRKP